MKISTLSLNKDTAIPKPSKDSATPTIAKQNAREKYDALVLRKENRKKALHWLCTNFPTAFNLDAPKPLALGIHTVIFKLKVRESCAQSNMMLRGALKVYVSTTKYLECILAHNRRYDIDGDPSGVVTADQKSTAREKLEKHTKK